LLVVRVLIFILSADGCSLQYQLRALLGNVTLKYG